MRAGGTALAQGSRAELSRQDDQPRLSPRTHTTGGVPWVPGGGRQLTAELEGPGKTTTLQ